MRAKKTQIYKKLPLLKIVFENFEFEKLEFSFLLQLTLNLILKNQALKNYTKATSNSNKVCFGIWGSPQAWGATSVA